MTKIRYLVLDFTKPTSHAQVFIEGLKFLPRALWLGLPFSLAQILCRECLRFADLSTRQVFCNYLSGQRLAVSVR